MSLVLEDDDDYLIPVEFSQYDTEGPSPEFVNKKTGEIRDCFPPDERDKLAQMWPARP